MAILKQIAFVLSDEECQILGDLVAPFEIWQPPPLYGNLPTYCYVKSGTNIWFRIKSNSQDIEFKFECLSLMIEKVSERTINSNCICIARLPRGVPAFLFRAEWVKPRFEKKAYHEWLRITENLSDVIPLPTKILTGCLSWVGILFTEGQPRNGLISLDNFPMSIRYTDNPEEIVTFKQQCHIVPRSGLKKWMDDLQSWEVRLMTR